MAEKVLAEAKIAGDVGVTRVIREEVGEYCFEYAEGERSVGGLTGERFPAPMRQAKPKRDEDSMSIERAKVEYWIECRDAMKARVEDLRRAYAEARAEDASEDELQSLRARGEELAARVQEGDRMIAEEEARLRASDTQEAQT